MTSPFSHSQKSIPNLEHAAAVFYSLHWQNRRLSDESRSLCVAGASPAPPLLPILHIYPKLVQISKIPKLEEQRSSDGSYPQLVAASDEFATAVLSSSSLSSSSYLSSSSPHCWGLSLSPEIAAPPPPSKCQGAPSAVRTLSGSRVGAPRSAVAPTPPASASRAAASVAF